MVLNARKSRWCPDSERPVFFSKPVLKVQGPKLILGDFKLAKGSRVLILSFQLSRIWVLSTLACVSESLLFHVCSKQYNSKKSFGIIRQGCFWSRTGTTQGILSHVCAYPLVNRNMCKSGFWDAGISCIRRYFLFNFIFIFFTLLNIFSLYGYGNW